MPILSPELSPVAGVWGLLARPTQGPVGGDAGGKRKPELVCSGSFPCKSLCVVAVKSCSSAPAGRVNSSGGGTGHCTTIGGAVGAVAQAVNNSSVALLKTSDFTA